MTVAAQAQQQPEAPQNLDAEESVLGALFLTGGGPLVDTLRERGLHARHFYRGRHGVIYRAIERLHDSGEPYDVVSVVAELRRHGELAEQPDLAKRAHELSTVAPAVGPAAHWATLVIEAAKRRRIGEITSELNRLSVAGEGAADEILTAALQQLEDITSGDTDELTVETWHQFESKAHDQVPALIDKVWPEGALAFLAAPPKKGKTWVGLAAAISIATGRPLFGHFAVPKPRPVLYVALEGHRSALRARVGALARGLGLDPGGDALDHLHFLYKPPGLNLADPAWVRRLRRAADQASAAAVFVDVLRRAAALKENSNEDFNALLLTLQPLLQDGRSVAVLHHFGKLTEIQKDRDPGERMSGAGAMFGALDVGIYITGSDEGARKLRLEFDLRDLATPDHLNVHLDGEGHGDNGGFTYRDTATFVVTEHDDVDEDDLKAPATDIYTWLAEHGGQATTAEICFAFETSDKTIRARETRLEQLGVEVTRKRGKPTLYVVLTDEELAERALTSEPRKNDDFRGQMALQQGLPGTSEPRKTEPLPRSENVANLAEPANPQVPSGSEVGTSEVTSVLPTSEVNACDSPKNGLPRNTPEVKATSGVMQGFSTSEPRNFPSGSVRAPTREGAREASEANGASDPDADLDALFGAPAAAADEGVE